MVCRDFDRARVQADTLDDELRGSGMTKGPLHGLPLTVKESITVEGLPTTNGDPARGKLSTVHVSDGPVAQALKAAGAIIMGKTNVPLNKADWQSFNDIYGTTSNPWDVSRTPGGSSGGSAAALAVCMQSPCVLGGASAIRAPPSGRAL